jgi:hypothetical protein
MLFSYGWMKQFETRLRLTALRRAFGKRPLQEIFGGTSGEPSPRAGGLGGPVCLMGWGHRMGFFGMIDRTRLARPDRPTGSRLTHFRGFRGVRGLSPSPDPRVLRPFFPWLASSAGWTRQNPARKNPGAARGRNPHGAGKPGATLGGPRWKEESHRDQLGVAGLVEPGKTASKPGRFFPGSATPATSESPRNGSKWIRDDILRMTGPTCCRSGTRRGRRSLWRRLAERFRSRRLTASAPG